MLKWIIPTECLVPTFNALSSVTLICYFLFSFLARLLFLQSLTSCSLTYWAWSPLSTPWGFFFIAGSFENSFPVYITTVCCGPSWSFLMHFVFHLHLPWILISFHFPPLPSLLLISLLFLLLDIQRFLLLISTLSFLTMLISFLIIQMCWWVFTGFCN